MDMKYKDQQDILIKEKLVDIKKDLPDAVCLWIDYMISQGKSMRTVLNYTYDIQLFFKWASEYLFNNKEVNRINPMDIDSITPLNMDSYLAYITSYVAGYKKNGKPIIHKNDACGKKRKLSSLNMFFKYAISRNILQNNPVSVMSLPKLPKKGIIRMNTDEAQEVISGAMTGDTLTENSKKHSRHQSLRDTAIISLMLGTGMRVSECVGLNLGDLHFEEGNNHCVISIKGGDTTNVYFSDTVAERIQDYIDNERKEFSQDDEALFLSRVGRRISVRSVQRLVEKYTKPVIQDGRHISPHKLRSTYATQVYRESRDVLLASKALNHSSPTPTMRYADLDDDIKRSAAQYTDGILGKQ